MKHAQKSNKKIEFMKNTKYKKHKIQNSTKTKNTKFNKIQKHAINET